MIRSSLADRKDKRLVVARVSNWSAVREGTLNSLTNPKSLLFMFAFLPQFADPATGPVWLQLAMLGTIQKLAGVVSLGSVAIASARSGSGFTNGRDCSRGSSVSPVS